MERNFGEAVARAYAGHRPNTDSKTGTISIYVVAGPDEVATALAAGTPTELFDSGD